MRKKTQAYNYVKNTTKYPLRFDHMLDTSSASGTEHSGRLKRRPRRHSAGSANSLRFAACRTLPASAFFLLFLWIMKCEFIYSGHQVFWLPPQFFWRSSTRQSLSWSRSSLPFVQSRGSLRFPQKPATSDHPDSATSVNHVYLKSNSIFSAKRTQEFQIFRIKFFF